MVEMVWGRVGKRNDFEIIGAISVVGEGLGGLTLSWMILAVLTIYTIMNGGGGCKDRCEWLFPSPWNKGEDKEDVHAHKRFVLI